MQEKHEQLGEHGAIPGVPNGPPPPPKMSATAGSSSSESSVSAQASPVVDHAGTGASSRSAGNDKEHVESAGALLDKPAVAHALEIHEVCYLFPPMSESEFAALKASIAVRGQTDPIWTWKGKVIDGRHRLRACIELGIEPKTQEWNGEGSLIEFVVAQNLTRRHLDESQRAMVAARLKPSFQADAQRRVLGDKDLDSRVNLPAGRARDHAANTMNVSSKSVEFACKVLQNGVPELISAVDCSKLAVSRAALIAKFPKDQQLKVLASPAEIDKAAKLVRSERQRQPAAAASGTGQEWSDKRLLETFNCLAAKLTKPGKTFRLELTRNWQDELCKAVYQRDDFMRIIRRGVLIVMKEE